MGWPRTTTSFPEPTWWNGGPDDWPPERALGPEYECHCCGNYFQPSQHNEKLINEDGELDVILVCDSCLEKRRRR